MKTEAYGSGWVARSNGSSQEDNPYDYDTQLVAYVDWDYGWSDADAVATEYGFVNPDEWRKA